KVTGRPAVVVTTSGTAVANLFPAVVEAAMSRVPLVALTADRPPELRGSGSNQTIDQVGIFGTYARWSRDAPIPTVDGEMSSWAKLARRAFAEAVGPPGGPVHLNLPFAEPLVPTRTLPPDTADGRPIGDGYDRPASG